MRKSTRGERSELVPERCFECEEVGVVQQPGGENSMRPVRPVRLNYLGDVLPGMDCRTLSEAIPARWAEKRH